MPDTASEHTAATRPRAGAADSARPHAGAGGQHADVASPLQALRDTLPTLTGATARAAAHIVAEPAEASRISITQLAAASDVSAATLTRLATLLGYTGFPALRAAIATEHGREVQGGWQRDIGTAISPEDSAQDVLGVLVSAQQRAARHVMGALDLDGASRAASWIAAAGRIHLHGEWGDSVALHELYLRLLRIGRPVWWHEGQQASRVAASLMGPGDVALVLARSSDDSPALEFCQLAGARGAHTVAIISDPDCDLAGEVDVALFTGTREGSAWTDYFAGRASDTLTAALLWVLVAQRIPDALGIEFVIGSGSEQSPPPNQKKRKR